MAENKEDNLKSEVAKREEEVLAFWQEHKVFEASVEREPAKGEFVFYDGPPFATGTPHFGHLLPTSLKDAIPRFQTMRGYRVRRRWGWDCHGLPVENVVEKDLGFKSKKDILDFGIDKFNSAARESVLRYAKEWREVIPRLGRWVDMDNDYKTMDPSYTETVWGVFKNLYDQGLIYEGYKSMHICPRCETTLSNFEVNQGYKDIVDLSATVKFELADEPGTYLLAWTTTPWTLPGNVALAINPTFTYAKVEHENHFYILAADRVEAVFGPEAKVEKTFPGSKLVGEKYQTIFDYYLKEGRVVAGDFVVLEEGTGVVHIAPAFGDDDYQLCQQEDLPFVQHVNMDGTFKAEVTDFAGLKVKPKGNHQETDKLILNKLKEEDKIFEIKAITHSYPHCWRCETPLLNYATSSWFVKVTAIKDKLVAANKKVNWQPEHIKEGRFGRWLEGARDWAISRSRFWGAPLPVWKCEDCEELKVIGNLADLSLHLPPSNNEYILVRHGESENNVVNRISSLAENKDHLTIAGQEAVANLADELKDQKIDLIVHSGFVRTKETAEILAQALGLTSSQVIEDQSFGELKAGDLEGGEWKDYYQFLKDNNNNPLTPLPNGESVAAVLERVTKGLNNLEQKFAGKKIMVISHGLPIFTLMAKSNGVEAANLLVERAKFGMTKHAHAYDLVWKKWPQNDRGELDLHRPYIDEVSLKCQCGGRMVRVPEVFDCWFESGSMPYFDKQNGFPADFIAEGLDQTRGWFYSLIVLGTALRGESPYKNVMVNGIILAEDGQKMSKRLKNYPDLSLTIDKYGADALRFYLLSTPATRAEEFAFVEADLAQTYRQVIQRLLNVANFYDTYAGAGITDSWLDSKNVLDQWILARLTATRDEVTKSLEGYQVDRAARSLADFIDDLSNWYIRRSRERFKSEDEEDKESAKAVTQFVLLSTAKLLAPFTPFVAEQLFQKLRLPANELSVHLEKWPEINFANEKLIEQMSEARSVVEAALALRGAAGIKVRQPLSRLTIKTNLPENLRAVVASEVNVKTVDVDESQAEVAILDTELTEELKAEGEVRDFIRAVQEERKLQGLMPGEEITLSVGGSEDALALLNKFSSEIKKAVSARELIWGGVDGKEVEVGGKIFTVKLGK